MRTISVYPYVKGTYHACESQRYIMHTKYQDTCSSLIYWGLPTYKCILNWVINSNGLSPVQYQSITWTNYVLFLIGHTWTKYIYIFIKVSSFIQENALKMLSAKWKPFCSGLDAPLGDVAVFWNMSFFNTLWWVISWIVLWNYLQLNTNGPHWR